MQNIPKESNYDCIVTNLGLAQEERSPSFQPCFCFPVASSQCGTNQQDTQSRLAAFPAP